MLPQNDFAECSLTDNPTPPVEICLCGYRSVKLGEGVVNQGDDLLFVWQKRVRFVYVLKFFRIRYFSVGIGLDSLILHKGVKRIHTVFGLELYKFGQLLLGEEIVEGTLY